MNYLIHFFNHSRLAWFINMVFLFGSVALTNVNSNTEEAVYIKVLGWVVFAFFFALHMSYEYWLSVFVKKLKREGLNRPQIAIEVSRVEIKYTRSLLRFYLFFKDSCTFGQSDIAGYFRTERFNSWNLKSSRS
jgi:hypothetical protein